MKRSLRSTIAIVLAIAGQLLTVLSPAFAADPGVALRANSNRDSAVFADVALNRENQLVGAVVNRAGASLPAIPVIVWNNSRQIASTITNDHGEFAVTLQRGGVLQIQAAGKLHFCRVWSPQAAPPSADSRLLLVAAERTLRAQGGAYPWISEHPWLFYGALATAIVVPIVVISSNDDDDSSS
jgi:hypothetical protein